MCRAERPGPVPGPTYDVRQAAANLPDETEQLEKLFLADEALDGDGDAELAADELADEEVVA